MRSCSEQLVDLLSFASIPVVSLLIVLLFLPNVEESRTHARKSQAWIKVRRFAAATDPGEAAGSERDPWGHAYRIVPKPDGGIRVVSSGPNEISPPEGLDDDDIYSDMPASPNAEADRQHILHMILAIIAGGATFSLLSVLYFRWRRAAYPSTGRS